jgi:hypothetical protein
LSFWDAARASSEFAGETAIAVVSLQKRIEQSAALLTAYPSQETTGVGMTPSWREGIMRLLTRSVASCRAALAVALIALSIFVPYAAVRAQEAAPAIGGAVIASGGEVVLLREQPGFDAVALQPLGDGSWLEVIGAPVYAGDGSSWLPVVAGGQSGFVPAGYISGVAAPASEVPADPAAQTLAATEPGAVPVAPAGLATTATDANLRAGPAIDADVMWVIPPGTTVSVDGPTTNGFVPVTANGTSGWVAAELLTTGSAPASTQPPPVAATEPVAEPATEALDATQLTKVRDHASTGIAWPMTGGEWEVVQGYNNGTHTNRSDFATYKYSLDWARVDGNTAGQPVVAPVSGTVQWVDRGSGGLLIDAGNGYGVTLFHVTLNRDLRSGSSVTQGQHLGQISGPGGEGYMSMAHIEIGVWQLNGRSHTSVPFTGANAIGGQEFPDSGGTNQHMGAKVTL